MARSIRQVVALHGPLPRPNGITRSTSTRSGAIDLMTTPRPNVILVMTDDQGYADLGCTGNPWIKTPHIDAFHGQAVRCEDFHVQPLCTPTRGSIMSGRRPVRNGAWATCWGRSILKKDEMTMADVFAANGYRTGMFGKWHLGDNYPYRPSDRGFKRTVAHRGGGVGQTPDFWGNNYFDDVYCHNDQQRQYEGYCTDVWFEQAQDFIEECGDEPFFAYIATNAPHCPYLVAEKYRALYEGNDAIPEPAFYGMITNIDENFGALDRMLHASGLADNTILIFMTDNGSSGGAKLDADKFCERGYNAGMRGMKGSYYEGGHRVPFFIRWPAGGISGGRDVDAMCLDIDLLPTFIDLCDLTPPRPPAFDGASIAPALRGQATTLSDRIHFLNIRQASDPPDKHTGAVLQGRWRLVHGTELYDVEADPEQRTDVAAAHPDIVRQLSDALDAWWDEVSPGFDQMCCISLGNDAENPTTLTAMDVMGDVAWHQTMITKAKHSTGVWNVDVERPGTYRFSLRRWPSELPIAIDATVSRECADSLIYGPAERVILRPQTAQLTIQGQRFEQPIDPGHGAAVFEIDLTQTGPTQLDAWFFEDGKEQYGAYYVDVERLADPV
jgi:arylsulfatase A-like enzyme